MIDVFGSGWMHKVTNHLISSLVNNDNSLHFIHHIAETDHR